MDIPIIIVCHNNHVYVDNTLKQLKNVNINYYKNVIIMDNCSTCTKTCEFLKNVDVKVLYNPTNNSPRISHKNNPEIFFNLPDKFILTDPDLEWNPNLPSNFIEILSELSDSLETYKIGFALDISDFDKMYQYPHYSPGKTIYEWEKQFWSQRKNHKYELYDALIDTTFSLVNKKYMYQDANKLQFKDELSGIRIAGNFTAKHLPWYIDNKLLNVYDTYILYSMQTDISTSKIMIYDHIYNHYAKITKDIETFFIPLSNDNIFFWTQIYPVSDHNMYKLFDKYLNQDKIFIDIGAWIGPMSLYASRKCKHVYSIEANKRSFHDLTNNMKNNANNYTLINKGIYNKTLIRNCQTKSYIFDENMFDIANQEENSSLQNILDEYQIHKDEVGIVKVDIHGEEEYILDDLYALSQENIPVLITIYYNFWINKDLDRFKFLSENNKNQIRSNHFVNILLTSKIAEVTVFSKPDKNL